MFALLRTISPYTGPDLLLGLFSSQSLAASARATYLETLRTGDPWSEQAYRKVDPLADVHAEKIEDHRVPGSSDGHAFLVTAHIEGMGQVVRRPLAAFSSEVAAREFGDALERGPDAEAPNWCDVDRIPVDHLLPPNTSTGTSRLIKQIDAGGI